MIGFYWKSEMLQQSNEFRIGFVNIGLGNVAVAVAATRIVGLASRQYKKGAQTRRCL